MGSNPVGRTIFLHYRAIALLECGFFGTTALSRYLSAGFLHYRAIALLAC